MNDPKIEAQIAELLRQPYEKVIRGDDEGGYLGTVTEFPGCVTAGETEGETLANLREAMAGWLESQLAHGQPIPPPNVVAAAAAGVHGGRMLLRLPRSLHRQLAARAKQDGVSTNQMAVALLAFGLGARDSVTGGASGSMQSSSVAGHTTAGERREAV